ncbi:FepA family TonB-dependent siderophore receptor [Pseudoroseicyclus aestuarii]|uniref:Ferric enterobactin receptor n=1 Tax=Pseudoroseicyclus aestuarii TaxID=1795041 RepID=A0A318SSG9_9RHOB|nr:FepA family TonB-dependent siderophore receptor [Pseudoroseicyclus aestuarii]PYE84482.1 ferric enterobactin receptor [Pseudoroseicyclus aestuarii]
MTHSLSGRFRGPSLLAVVAALAAPAGAQEAGLGAYDLDLPVTLDPIIVQAASEELKQAPGVSTISEEDLEAYPPANDISEIIRRQPGVNLTGNTTTGQRGNNRQIDLRGMGPENTLILIDGRPALSRNSVRMGRSGERDTRGDSNWVPAELVERIEVLRGPAAARYGSGASGGVVNIITKRPAERFVTFSLHYERPEDSLEGGSRRANVLFGGPLSETLSYRAYLNRNETEGDDPALNADAVDEGETVYAGREGVNNTDGNIALDYRPNAMHTWGAELGLSRQSNAYAGDSLFRGVVDDVEDDAGEVIDLIGEETNRIDRRTLALSHDGLYGFGDSQSYLQWEHSENERLTEGFAGGGEGTINSTDTSTITLDTVTAKSEWNIVRAARTLTFGAEYRGEWMDDETVDNGLDLNTDVDGTATASEDRDPTTDAHSLGLYAEENWQLSDAWTLTSGLRADLHSEAGFTLSPSVNATWQMSSAFELKLGISRAFKAPNLFQLNPDYLYYTRGNGCPVNQSSSGGCYILGNADLDHETSWNSEIGLAYRGAGGVVAGVTYFHNDYDDKITAGLEPVGIYDTRDGRSSKVFRWQNVTEATIQGLEANLSVPLSETLTWSTNATVMDSENKVTGDPLSLVPDYTINSSLDWQATDAWTLNLYLTHYGETPAAQTSVTSGAEIEDTDPVDPYTLFGLTTTYQLTEAVALKGGIKNLFDERLLRSGEGANTYNEPGRSVFVGLSASF